MRFIIVVEKGEKVEKEETTRWFRKELPLFRDICSEERWGDQYKSFRLVDDNIIFESRIFILFPDE